MNQDGTRTESLNSACLGAVLPAIFPGAPHHLPPVVHLGGAPGRPVLAVAFCARRVQLAFVQEGEDAICTAHRLLPAARGGRGGGPQRGRGTQQQHQRRPPGHLWGKSTFLVRFNLKRYFAIVSNCSSMSRDQTHRLTDRRPTRKLLRHPSATRNTVGEIQFRAQQTV